jgi:putative restriction endonuclease
MLTEQQLSKLYNLKRDRGSGWEKPYKPALLLALIDLIENGSPKDNCFLLSDALIARYRDYIAVVGRERDHDKIHYPFWHLCGDGIWMIHTPTGEALYRPGDNAANSPSVRWMRERMSHASLEPALFRKLCDPITREHIRLDLIARYFPGHRDALLRLVSTYLQVDKAAEDPAERAADPTRSAAFARTIKEVYDYRCAASGVRFRLGDLTIVDACHLIPFAESGNDHPTNGIALSKNHHWALDRHLITPFATETKLVWRTAPCLDDRLEGHKKLLELEGRSVLLPREKRFWPSDEGLQWRAERLRGLEGAVR